MNVITWNMQGATGGSSSSFDIKKASTRYESKWVDNIAVLIKSNNVGVMLLQEVGSLPNGAIPVSQPINWLKGFAPPGGMAVGMYQWNLGSSYRKFIVNILWVLCDTGANRNNLAIVWTDTLKASTCFFVDNVMDGRPSIGVTLTENSSAVNFFTLHAFSPGGNDGPGLTSSAAGIGAPYFIAGDFNRDPQDAVIPSNGYLCSHDAITTHPGTGTNLDYAISSASSVYGTVLSDYVASDHFPVMYNV